MLASKLDRLKKLLASTIGQTYWPDHRIETAVEDSIRQQLGNIITSRRHVSNE